MSLGDSFGNNGEINKSVILEEFNNAVGIKKKFVPFTLVTEKKPAGGQLFAIEKLTKGILDDKRDQVLLGVTGSGKTFTMANIIQETQRPAVIMAHNKTLAAQLYSEMKNLFPNNAVEYFVSYYDYYQPEAYIAKTDTYIEKDSAINKQIEIFRHSTTMSLMQRRDVIVVTSVSSIYGIGSPEHYGNMVIRLEVGMQMTPSFLVKELVRLSYVRNDVELDNGRFRVRGDIIYFYPPYNEDIAYRIEFFGEEIEEIWEFDALTNKKVKSLSSIIVLAATHYATPEDVLKRASSDIFEELKERVAELKNLGKFLEADRIDQRVRYDMEMMLSVGSFKGIENYSRHLDGRKPGEPPSTLFDYIDRDAIVFVDESHVTVPQISGMHVGDRVRKTNLVEHGFRLPSALDHRPLRFEEWDKKRTQTIYVSATPAQYEIDKSDGEVVEQIIRPTGLLDPVCGMRPIQNHMDDLIREIRDTTAKGLRTIVIVLTKQYAEKTHSYFQEIGIKSVYIHSDTKTLDRIEILKSVREGKVDVIVGINLLREGIDMPECGLVAITDADKEGFLRSKASLIQIVGRAARNSNGRVIFYGDKLTGAIDYTMKETARRRQIQEEYNKMHNIVPTTVVKRIDTAFDDAFSTDKKPKPKTKDAIIEGEEHLLAGTLDLQKEIVKLTKEMKKAASALDFDKAALIRDKLKIAKEKCLLVGIESYANND